MFILNFTPVAHEKYTVKAPCKGRFTEILNSDDETYGGQGRLNKKPILAKKKKLPAKTGNAKAGKTSVLAKTNEEPEYEIQCYLPPLSVVVLRYNYSEA